VRNYYKDGSWNTVCQRCGLKHKAEELKVEWTGLHVCSPCWEPRHPQTLLKVPQEQVATPWSSPEPADTFINVPYIASNIGTQT
jgi:hypothetical protein